MYYSVDGGDPVPSDHYLALAGNFTKTWRANRASSSGDTTSSGDTSVSVRSNAATPADLAAAADMLARAVEITAMKSRVVEQRRQQQRDSASDTL